MAQDDIAPNEHVAQLAEEMAEHYGYRASAAVAAWASW